MQTRTTAAARSSCPPPADNWAGTGNVVRVSGRVVVRPLVTGGQGRAADEVREAALWPLWIVVGALLWLAGAVLVAHAIGGW